METILKYVEDNLLIVMFVLPIYETKICYIKYDTSDAYNQALKYCENIGINTNDYKSDEYMYAYGFTFKDKGAQGFIHFIFMNGSEEYKEDFTNTLAHENYHLISKICEHHGLEEIDGGDNEHIAYLTGYLFNTLSNFNKNI